jgi:iron complex transport system substrate-binding protein
MKFRHFLASVLLGAVIFNAAGQAICFAAPFVTVDDLGRTIRLPHRPTRIVSLEPSVTEVLYAVGGENKLVADDDFSDYPVAAKSLIHVNGAGPSREMIVGLQPDLIILYDQAFTVSKANQWQQSLDVPVYVTNQGTYKGVEEDIERLGALAGGSQATDSVIRSMDRTLATVKTAVAGRPKPKVFVAIWDHPLMTAGRGTFVGDLIELAGGVNVAAKRVSGYSTYSPEQLVADNPDIILTGNRDLVTVRRTESGVASLGLRAERDGNSYAVPDDWTVRPGPRLALGLMAIAKVLHPECFNRSAHYPHY